MKKSQYMDDDSDSEESLEATTNNLQQNLREVNEDILRLARDNADQIAPQIDKSKNLVEQIGAIRAQIASIGIDLEVEEHAIRNVSEIDEYKTVLDRIEMIDTLISAIQSLKQFESHLSELKTAIDVKNYGECDAQLAKLSEQVGGELFAVRETEDDADAAEIAVVKELREELTVQRERLWYELDIEWDTLVQINLDGTAACIHIDARLDQTYLDATTTLAHYKSDDGAFSSFVFSSKLKQLCKLFLQLCQECIIERVDPMSIEEETSEDGAHALRFGVAAKVAKDGWDEVEDASTSAASQLRLKLSQIEHVMRFLNAHLLSLNVSTATDRHRLMDIFAQLVLDYGFIELIYTQLIIQLIPLEEYSGALESAICAHVDAFEHSLHDLQFLSPMAPSAIFGEFVGNVEVLYVRKKCKHLMVTAREMLKNKKLFFETSKVQDRAVSKMASGVLALVRATLDEAVQLSEGGEAKSLQSVSILCLVAKNLVELYIGVVPVAHRDELRDVPTLSAICYNDCEYLAENCMTLTADYKRQFSHLRAGKPNELRREEVDEVFRHFSCLDLAPRLLEVGDDIFIAQVEAQEKLLLQFVHEDCNGLRDLSEGDNYDQLTRALQKCSFQLNNLSTTWLNLLPPEKYSATFGRLYHSLCNDMIKSCLKFEDISTDDAAFMYEAFALIKQSALSVFTKLQGSEKEGASTVSLVDFTVTKHVVSWERFKQLMLLLKSNLQEILDLWSDGAGPLAISFDSEEVRHCIRALFMISDRRAAALAKIR